jgi:peptidoglycan/xylan/chitin deacetylase (PgdA/CDA1 family)
LASPPGKAEEKVRPRRHGDWPRLGGDRASEKSPVIVLRVLADCILTGEQYQEVLRVIKRKIVVWIMAVLVFSGVSYFFYSLVTELMKPTANNFQIADISANYNAADEIAEATNVLRAIRDRNIGRNAEDITAIADRAPVITADGGRRGKEIALTFDGLADRAVVRNILLLLKKHGARATFFADGLQTAENPESIADILAAGFPVENYTYAGMAKMERLPAYRLVSDFSRAQKIITHYTRQPPNLLKCNDTVYTRTLLEAANASGIRGVVKTSVFFDYGGAADDAAIDGFVAKIQPGDIVSVNLLLYYDAIDIEKNTEFQVAVDKRPGLKNLPPLADIEQNGLLAALDKLLNSLQKIEYHIVGVENFAKKDLVEDLPRTAGKPAGRQLRAARLGAGGGKGGSYLAELAKSLQDGFMGIFTVKTAWAAEKAPELAPEIKIVTTTEQALSFTFGGLSKEWVVDDMLARLDRLGIKGTFFVAEIEMRRYPALLRKIIASGHEVGLAIGPKPEESADEVRMAIKMGLKRLQNEFGVTTKLVKQPYGAIGDAAKEAVAAAGCLLVGQSLNAIQSKHIDYKTAAEIMPDIFPRFRLSLGRGEIVHFRLDYYAHDDVVGNLLEEIKTKKIDNIAYNVPYDNPENNPANDSWYLVKPVGEVLYNEKFAYEYPAPVERVPEHLREIAPLEGYTGKNLLPVMQKRYIGSASVNENAGIIGFSLAEIRRLDKSGQIRTDDNVVFLTFDDWGNDLTINKVLYVLRKHNAKATFFIITRTVLNNKNLLRAIAAEGHEVASHSELHSPMAIRKKGSGKYVKGAQSKEEYYEDVAMSFRKLRDVVGDISFDGKYALSRLFRPPTLAISKVGADAIFRAGFEYMVSGSTSTSDYIAPDVFELEDTIRGGIYQKNGHVKKGAVLVMHINDNAVYTPMAVDLLLAANAERPDGDPGKFVTGKLSDYLKGGYEQQGKGKTAEAESVEVNTETSLNKGAAGKMLGNGE